ncbi:MAG: prolipoprotein diacylglyceryl transferase [Candidatus Omnitrophica bacterium]|nr:MAG: Prolipoprotein diacylglyceryl transferase [Candidatus Hinthialibacteria bacterium OLB16]MCL4734367.1 prolipoprotein diacylglyceryl transferase [Candidatus Omnitrophota bacterium]
MWPILFRIGDFEVGTFGLMVAIGFFAGYATAVSRAIRAGYPEEKISNMLILCLVMGVLGAKILHVIVYFNESTLSELVFSRRGLVFYGGLIGGVLTGWWIVWRNGWNPAEVADLLAPSVALGEFFGRIGCLLNGCCFGKICSNPLGIRFPRIEYKGELIGSDPFYHQLVHGLIPPDAAQSLPVYPTQAFSSLAALATFLFLVYVLFPRRSFKGQVALTYLILYSVCRFLIEVFRDDPRGSWFPGLSTSQGISVGVLIAAIGMWIYLKRQDHAARKDGAPQAQP